MFTKELRDLFPPEISKFTIGANKAFDQIANDFFENQNKVTYPPFNIKAYEDGSYEITVAAAGLDEEDLSVETQNGLLIITGEKRCQEADQGVYFHKGISDRKFTRQFAMAENHEVSDVVLKNGLLTVFVKYNVPEKLASKKHKISVKQTKVDTA